MRILSLFPLACCLLLAACFGSSGGPAPELDKADSRQAAETPGPVEISLGMPANRLLQLLGAADETRRGDAGRQIWQYVGKRAAFVYVSNRNNAQTLIIGGYTSPPPASPENPSPPSGLPLQLTVVFDAANKVVDFAFSQLNF
ncbi:MAG: hypothetical protein LBV01_00290 [Deltaproteobacteria bacterium]|nr:hypothetical protein [Deltaproteobacteria bacterium]